MNQPELGKKINEIRTQKGIMQKDLSESCNIDIRTIQRIEAGDVVPRVSTLKLIAAKLDSDISMFKASMSNKSILFIRKMLIISFVAGVVNFINWFFYTDLIPNASLYDFKTFIILSLIYIFSVAILYYGFYYLGKYQENKLLKITSIIYVILAYLYVTTDLIVRSSSFPSAFIYLNKLALYSSNINGILFGFGLLMSKSRYAILYKITGILHIILVPLFFFSIVQIVMAACWLAAAYYLLLFLIVFCEYRFYARANKPV